MKKRTFTSIVMTIVFAVLLLGIGERKVRMAGDRPLSFYLDSTEVITPRVIGDKSVWRLVWRIDNPDVKKNVTAYPQIFFHTGDYVTVSAGGCVQTGGHGSTWKRYVDPRGSGSDHLYHGLIGIPGVFGSDARGFTNVGKEKLTRLASAQRSLTVPQNGSLTLGYEDDDYSDNGYWNHDDGTEDQCKGVGNAWVEINITSPLPEGLFTVSSSPGGGRLTSLVLIPHYKLRASSAASTDVYSPNGVLTGTVVPWCTVPTDRRQMINSMVQVGGLKGYLASLQCKCESSTCISTPIRGKNAQR